MCVQVCRDRTCNADALRCDDRGRRIIVLRSAASCIRCYKRRPALCTGLYRDYSIWHSFSDPDDTGGNHLIRADRSPTYSMTCMLTGAIINTILDPLFILDSIGELKELHGQL